MSKKPNQIFRNINAKIASIPMILTVLFVFLGGSIWTMAYSFTSSRLLPKWKFVGFDQYERLWETRRWIISIENLALYGIFSLIFTLVIGFTLAALLDRKIRFENTFRTILLYPFALSFIVTGLTWQWILNPDFGLQGVIRDLGWEAFSFDPLNDPETVMFGLLISGLWQGTGLIMVILLAGLRGIDEDIWRAARIDGIGTVKTYIRIIIPMMRPVFVTALVSIAAGIIKIYTKKPKKGYFSKPNPNSFFIISNGFFSSRANVTNFSVCSQVNECHQVIRCIHPCCHDSCDYVTANKASHHRHKANLNAIRQSPAKFTRPE